MTDLAAVPSDARGRTVSIIVASDDSATTAALEAAAAARPEEWNVVIAASPAGALQFVEAIDVDVVVALAGGDGSEAAQLFDAVRRMRPRAARIAACDPADRGAVMRLAGVAHQCLDVPVDVDVVTNLVERVRTATHTELLEPVRELIGQVDKLPSPPAMFKRLGEILASDDWSIKELAAEISQDAALTGEILRLVNSSFYGTAERVTTIERAISLVGVETIRFVVLGNTMFQSSGGFETWIDLERLANRSQLVARGARALAIREGETPRTITTAYLAGLVSEIGLLVLARIPDIAPSIAAPVNGSTFLGAERVIFGGDRFEVGAVLLTLWGFEESVVEAVGRLSANEVCHRGEIAWYLAIARQLVMGDSISPEAIEQPAGTDPVVDQSIEALRALVERQPASAA